MPTVQTADAAQWWALSRREGAVVWIDKYQGSLEVRHRLAISGIVGQIPGVSSVLEIGCHCGPNLVRLARDHPHLTLAGIDVNAEAVKAGIEWMQQLGLSDRVRLDCATFPKATTGSVSGCVDVVLSCYSLAYVSPTDIDHALYECGRLAKKAVILAEPMTDKDEEGETFMGNGYHEWAHRFAARVPWIASLRGCEVGMVAVDPPVDRLNSILVLIRRS